MATFSRRQQILEALMARVQRIERANEFQTDAGQTTFLGEAVELGKDDKPEAIAVVPGDSRPAPNRMEVIPVEIIGLAKADLDFPHVAAEAILADIAAAVELDDRTLGGLVKSMEVGPTRQLQREPGTTTVGISITYELTWVRVWGAP